MNGMILPMIDRLRRITLLRYLLASVGALAVDMGSFLTLLALGTIPVAASAAGYSLGIVAHWLLSSRTVFTDEVASERGARNRQKALFVGSALLGLGLTTLIVAAGTMIGVDSRLAKIAAIGASFTATWLLRKRVVFQ
ncbi:MAG TPA: GtrA family protein [Novosphingobium sp.]|nr:GtrA family protein [Novosphingobium sp. 17-62-19]HQS95626.1 GtrA family protein [Novosphingobium sp.]